MSQLHAVVGGNPRARFGRASPNLVCGHTHTTPDNHHQLSSAVRLQVVWSDCLTENFSLMLSFSFFKQLLPSPWVWHRERLRGEREKMWGDEGGSGLRPRGGHDAGPLVFLSSVGESGRKINAHLLTWLCEMICYKHIEALIKEVRVEVNKARNIDFFSLNSQQRCLLTSILNRALRYSGTSE